MSNGLQNPGFVQGKDSDGGFSFMDLLLPVGIGAALTAGLGPLIAQALPTVGSSMVGPPVAAATSGAVPAAAVAAETAAASVPTALGSTALAEGVVAGGSHGAGGMARAMMQGALQDVPEPAQPALSMGQRRRPQLGLSQNVQAAQQSAPGSGYDQNIRNLLGV